jgi:hypothetical protein
MSGQSARYDGKTLRSLTDKWRQVPSFDTLLLQVRFLSPTAAAPVTGQGRRRLRGKAQCLMANYKTKEIARSKEGEI